MEKITLRQRLRGLFCVWLAVFLLVPTVLTLPVAAAENEAGDWDALQALAVSSDNGVYDFGDKTINITNTIEIRLYDFPVTLKNATFLCNSPDVSNMFSFYVWYSDGEVTLDDITIDGATAEGQHTNSAIRFEYQSGGTLTANIANSTLKNWSLSGNVGGAIYLDDVITLNMTKSSISNCSAEYGGGGVFNDGGIFNMTESSITGCTVGYGSGGGVYNLGTFNMTDSSITGCTVDNGSGGGVNNDYGNFNMKDSSITGCMANSESGGGGVYSSTLYSKGTNKFNENHQFIRNDNYQREQVWH